MSHFFVFLWAIINNWAGYATGGLVMATLFLRQTLSKKWEPSKKLLKRLSVLFFALAVFDAWNDQYTCATHDKALLDERSPKLSGWIHRSVVLDEPGTS